MELQELAKTIKLSTSEYEIYVLPNPVGEPNLFTLKRYGDGLVGIPYRISDVALSKLTPKRIESLVTGIRKAFARYEEEKKFTAEPGKENL